MGRRSWRFPGGDEWEHERQGMIGALEELLDAGRVKILTVNAINAESFFNRQAHPFHRSLAGLKAGHQQVHHEQIGQQLHRLRAAGPAIALRSADAWTRI